MAALLTMGCADDDNSEQSNEGSTSTQTAEPIYTSYNGLVMAGYQAWFSTPGDGTGLDWTHYCGTGSIFEPGMNTVSIEFWPEMDEYEKKYLTPFVDKQGNGAYVFSSADYSTTDLHFKWMQEYGLDGVFLQRFLTSVLNSDTKRAQRLQITQNVARAAQKYNRAWSVMYDLSGASQSQIMELADDLAEMEEQIQFTDPAVCPTYLHHNGKPMLAIWGVGFTDDRDYDCADVLELIKTIDAQDKYSLLIGVPYKWLKNSNEDEFWEILKLSDMIMTWAVGRYDYDTYDSFSDGYLDDDIAWCQANGIDYAPLVFPGSSTGNLNNDASGYDKRPRYQGDFMWDQIYKSISHGSKALYIAMFDEVDEGTAIFKCCHEEDLPLNGDGEFVAIEDEVETDHYLWLAGEAAKMLREEESYTAEQPTRDLND